MLGTCATGKSMSVWGDCGEKVNIQKQANRAWSLIEFNHDTTGGVIVEKK
jgi:hypothetical protein